jgi:hypothetical protein
MSGGGMPRQDKDAGANDGANAKRDKTSKRKRPAQLCFAWQRSDLAFHRFGLKHCYRLARPHIRHSQSLLLRVPLLATRHNTL